jgi:hypothetical protein
MLIRLDNQGSVSIIEAGEASYSATQDELLADAPDLGLAIPAGMALVTFDTDTGVTVGYDAKGNAFPGVDWHNAADLHARADALKQAHTARHAADDAPPKNFIRPQEVVSDTQDIATKTEVTIL